MVSVRWHDAEVVDDDRDPDIAAAFGRYSDGDIGALDDLPVDFSDVQSRFVLEVLATLRSVRGGQLVTYGELAKRVGRRLGAQAIGQAMAANPMPVVVPCHRVVAADGLGGFTGGRARKDALLAHEGHLLPLE